MSSQQEIEQCLQNIPSIEEIIFLQNISKIKQKMKWRLFAEVFRFLKDKTNDTTFFMLHGGFIRDCILGIIPNDVDVNIENEYLFDKEFKSNICKINIKQRILTHDKAYASVSDIYIFKNDIESVTLDFISTGNIQNDFDGALRRTL